VLASGPPLYKDTLSGGQRERAWKNALRLADGVSTLILDHHLMRSLEGPTWLESLSAAVGRKVLCAADFVGRPRQLLEARRRQLFAAYPVRAGWHDDYARGVAGVDQFADGITRQGGSWSCVE